MPLTIAAGAIEPFDPDIAGAIEREARRQHDGLELIASENYPSEPVLAAMGSILTNKYAEGYPGRRYYGGCEFVDVVETLAIERAKSLFGADHANVQSHSGSQANLAAYYALLEPGDTAMGLELNHGGHLSHGLPVNISGRWFQFVSYGVDRETERIDYDAMLAVAREHRPKVIVVGATAYPRHYDFARAAEIAEDVDATLMVDMAHFAGLVAGGVHPSPVPYAPVVTTTTHKTLRGPRSALILTNDAMARPIDRAVFPGTSGGPHMHTIAAKAIALKEAATPEFAAYAAQIVANTKALAQGLAERGPAPRLRRHRQPSRTRRCRCQGSHRQSRRDGARRRRDHRQQEHHPLRRAAPHRHQRRADRHARPHHARHARGRNGRSGATDRSRARRGG